MRAHSCGLIQSMWRATKYEQKSHANEMSGAICEYFLRIAGARSTEQSAFMRGGAGEARMGVYYNNRFFR